MQISPIEALRVALSRAPMLPQAYYSLPPEARLNATTVSGLASLEQIRYVIDSLNQTLANGGTFADFQAAVRLRPDLLHLPDHRLDNVFRTNIQTAYNQGRMNQQLQDTRRVYWMYSAINDSRTRPAHRAWNGTILHRDHPWWRTHVPPCGFRCFLPETIIQGDLKGAIRRKYFGVAVEILTMGGRSVRLTGNHPVLSSRGWVRADMLNSGDHLLSYGNPVNAVDINLGSVQMNNDQPIPSAKNLFEAVCSDALGFAKGSALQFNRDVLAHDCEVEVDVDQRGLMVQLKSKLGAGAKEKFFVRRNNAKLSKVGTGSVALQLSGGNDFVFSKNPCDVPSGGSDGFGKHIPAHVSDLIELKNSAFQFVVRFPSGFPGSSALSGSAVGRLFDGLPLDQFRLASTTDENAFFEEYSAQGWAADAGLFRYLLEAYAGPIGIDPVVSVRKFNFCGHVYDFQSSEGVVIADGIIAHNCRCSVISLTQAQAAKRGITPDGQIDSTPPDKGFAGQPSTDAAAYRDLVEQAVRDAMNDFPQSAAPAISQWRDSLTLAEQVADTLKRTLPTLSEDVAKQLPAAVLRAEKLGLESPEGLHMAAAYLDEHGADLNNLLARAQTGTAADALAASTVRDAVAELTRVAPNAAPVEFVLSHLDAMPLKVGAVVELEGNRLAKAAMPATTAQVRVRVNRGGVDLAELALADAVLLTTGSRYRVLSETMVDGVMLLTLELTNRPATETLY